MSMTTPGTTKVAIIPFQTRDDASPNPFHPSGLPPRSRLYGLVPCLSREYPKRQLGAFSRGPGMQVNGTGSIAQEWASFLEQLTMRSNLHVLALDFWIGDLSSRGHLRKVPAWCPTCYTEWAEQDLPLYQPMLWILQIVTISPRHKSELKDLSQP